MNTKLITTLAKVIIAAGWADKELTSEEKNNLKDLLLQFQQAIEPRTLELADYSGLSPETWAMFEMYTNHRLMPRSEND
jgi:predicted molibdopterin-dependent oxidoreductase YjgC